MPDASSMRVSMTILQTGKVKFPVYFYDILINRCDRPHDMMSRRVECEQVHASTFSITERGARQSRNARQSHICVPIDRHQTITFICIHGAVCKKTHGSTSCFEIGHVGHDDLSDGDRKNVMQENAARSSIVRN